MATRALQEYYSGAIGLDELGHRLEKDGNLVLARYRDSFAVLRPSGRG